MPTLDEHGRLTGKFESIDHFIDCHTRLCKECGKERTSYELHEDRVCVYCRQQKENNDVLD